MYYSLVDIYNTRRLNNAPIPPSSNLLDALRDDFLQVSIMNMRMAGCHAKGRFLVCHECR